MRTAVFSTKSYDRQFLMPAADAAGHEMEWFEPRLTRSTCPLARGFPAICTFVNDTLDATILRTIHEGGTRFVALRCAGFNQVDLAMAAQVGIQVARVPVYSPYAVAEHMVGLMLALNRKIYKAYNRVREDNFSLERLLGFDLRGKTVGVFGTGQIGTVTARILHGFGCRLLLVDVQENDDCREWGTYVNREQLFAEPDIITLHCPLLSQTHHLIDDRAIAKMKQGVMLINTSRGALIDTQAVISGLKSSRIAYLGLDVYEEEADLFFEDLSGEVIQDDVFARLLTFPNVLVTAHQAFFTSNALAEIARVTMANLTAFADGRPLTNAVTVDRLKR